MIQKALSSFKRKGKKKVFDQSMRENREWAEI